MTSSHTSWLNYIHLSFLVANKVEYSTITRIIDTHWTFKNRRKRYRDKIEIASIYVHTLNDI